MRLARGVLVAMLMWSPSLVRADGRPWATGVSEGAQAIAKQLLVEGEALYLDGRYADALDKFREALAAWNHPALHFDIMKCEIQLERPVEALEDLEHALAYGQEALPEGRYAEALAYRKLLAKQVGELTVQCREPGATVSVDGKLAGSCPIERTRKIEAGEHQVVAAKRGYLTETQSVVVLGGKRAVARVVLTSLDHAGIEVRRWHVAMPWLVVGGGMLATGFGGLVLLEAARNYETYDRQVRSCSNGQPCPLGNVDGGVLRLADREKAVAYGLFAVGTAVVLTGGTLLYLNRAHTIYPTAMATPEGASLGVRGAF